jgi:pimeloyl-ACP methyl ester carboxylesterase
MSHQTHRFAPNLFVEAANGVRYAYRRFGNAVATPLVCLPHFRGTLDCWDPALIDAIAREREVILIDNAGVGLSSGSTPDAVSQMARDIISFTDSLRLQQTDVLGFSLGGFVAQEIALLRPELVRKLVLAATGPKGGPDMHGWRKDIADAARKTDFGDPEILTVLFEHTETSQAKGREYLARSLERTEDRDVPCSVRTRDAQYDAIVAWGVPDHGKLLRLAAIEQPTLAASGDNDLMIPPRLTHLLGALIPDAQVKIYPDSGHGFLFQHHAQFAADVNGFLDA